jgi:hypothetical protein
MKHKVLALATLLGATLQLGFPSHRFEPHSIGAGPRRTPARERPR